MIVDLFCGGGGASLGIKWATGRCPDIAVNHSAAAIAMHMANHPKTIHLETDVFEVQPRRTVKRREVELLWASPDCTHFSRAKGKAPRSAKIRSLAWVIVEWAREVQPRIIAMENVPEFTGWGPLYERCDTLADGSPVPEHLVDQPIPERKGELFRAFTDALKIAGYKLEWRTLRACDFGAPTTRERFFLVARCDGDPIVWPDPTHGSPKMCLRDPSLLPWRTAAECIDWSLPCPSIFDRKKPLAEAAQRRIAEGIRRYVLTSAKPFIVRYHGERRDGERPRVESLGDPLPTQTTEPRFAVVAPQLQHLTHGGRTHDPTQPMPTVTAAHRGEIAAIVATLVTNTTGHPGAPVDEPLRTITTGGHHALVSAALINTRNGEREGQTPRTRSVEEPYLTITGGGSQGAVAAAFLAKHYGGVVGHEVTRPLGTVTAVDHHSVVAATLVSHGGRNEDVADPLKTITATPKGGDRALVAAHITKFRGTSTGSEAGEPLGTVTGQGLHHGLVTAELGEAGEGARRVAAFLLKFYQQGGQWSDLNDPMHTIVSRARMGLVTVDIDGETYAIVDIGLRMLQPHELARAQGFPADYVLTGTKSEKIARIGNSVPPQLVEAVVRANLGERSARRAAA